MFLWGFLKDLKRNIVYVFTFTGWILYNNMGMIRECYAGNKDTDSSLSNIFLWLTVTSVLIFLGIKFIKTRKIKSSFSFIENLNVSNKTFFILIGLDVVLTIYKIILAGGFYEYFYAGYGMKIESSFMTFFNLFSGILNNALLLTFPFIRYKVPLYMKVIALLYFFFNIVLDAIGGSSLAIFSPFLLLFTFLYFTIKINHNKTNLKKWMCVLLFFAVVSGVLIRQNRTDNSNFSTDVLYTAVDDIMKSATFDNISNLEKIFQIEPTYTPGQFVYPYIHFLPRSAFEWKPMEMGRVVAYKIKGYDESRMVGFIPSPLGEFYYDFGYLGIILGMLYVGIIIALFQEMMNNSSESPWKLVIVLGFCRYTTILAGWYTGFGVREVRLGLFVLLLLFINQFFKSKKIKYGTPD
ncbi:hypothetical protein FACS189429_3990 [Bacteroidia bacterium]|nr:hypothetical protein FACS189429_3990 [Bacteroidia bacterium]